MLLKLLELLGRKSVMVDFYGRVLMERYHLFYYEDEDHPRWYSWLPNIFVHVFPGPNSPDAKDDAHKHPWTTLGICLRGGYTEVINGTRARRKRLAYLSYKDNHRIDTVVPGTVTVFLHWIRRQPWTFELNKCADVCPTCRETRGGSCFKQGSRTWSELFEMSGRDVKWVRVDLRTAGRLKRRRDAVAKKGLEVPAAKEETFKLFRERVARREHDATH